MHHSTCCQLFEFSSEVWLCALTLMELYCFLSCHGYHTSSSHFMPKELGFYRFNARDKAPNYFTESGSLLFKADRSLSSLNSVYRLNAAWVRANVHGLDFHRGFVNQSMFRKILRNITADCDYVFTKGEGMRLFLSEHLHEYGVEVYNIEAIYPECPKLTLELRGPTIRCM